MEQKFIHDIVAEANLLSLFFMQIFENMLCKETQWSCEIQNRILYQELFIKSKGSYWLCKPLFFKEALTCFDQNDQCVKKTWA